MIAVLIGCIPGLCRDFAVWVDKHWQNSDLISITVSAVSTKIVSSLMGDIIHCKHCKKMTMPRAVQTMLVCFKSDNVGCRGGFGVVLWGQVHREEAAIKLIKGRSREKEMLQEIAILERAKTNYVTRFLGYTVCPDGIMLCMEYMAGGTLYEALHISEEFQWRNRQVVPATSFDSAELLAVCDNVLIAITCLQHHSNNRLSLSCSQLLPLLNVIKYIKSLQFSSRKQSLWLEIIAVGNCTCDASACIDEWHHLCFRIQCICILQISNSNLIWSSVANQSLWCHNHVLSLSWNKSLDTIRVLALAVSRRSPCYCYRTCNLYEVHYFT